MEGSNIRKGLMDMDNTVVTARGEWGIRGLNGNGKIQLIFFKEVSFRKTSLSCICLTDFGYFLFQERPFDLRSQINQHLFF